MRTIAEKILLSLLSDFEIAALEAAHKRNSANEICEKEYFDGQAIAFRHASAVVFEALRRLEELEEAYDDAAPE